MAQKLTVTVRWHPNSGDELVQTFDVYEGDQIHFHNPDGWLVLEFRARGRQKPSWLSKLLSRIIEQAEKAPGALDGTQRAGSGS